jgi:outer membrane protein assembly factor BamA
MAEKTLRAVTAETVAGLRKKLKALPSVEEKKLTKSEVIRDLADVIQELRAEKGYTYAAVAKVISEHGVKVSGRSIQIALATAKGETAGSKAGTADGSGAGKA